MTRAIDIIDNYKILISEIGNMIDVSGYRQDYVAEKVGLRPNNFSAKKKRKSFNIEEVEKICNVILNEDVEDYLLLKLMENLKDKEEENLDYDEFKEEMSWN